MDLFKHGMKGPLRPAPSVPPLNGVNRYSPVTNWNDDPFGADVFEPTPQFAQKKKPPPRPPPPKLSRQPDIPAKPSHFIRKPTVLTSLLSRKSKTVIQNTTVKQQTVNMDFGSELDTHKMFPKCETKNVQTGALIDFSSPPSSPTFTTRSSSDGLSVDSFGSDATTSTNHHNHFNGGNVSQPESGFEDDFDLFLNNRKQIHKEDTLDDLFIADPFSPQPLTKPPIMKKPVMNRDIYDSTSNIQGSMFKGPTIIRAKPARPKPPDGSAILKSTLGNNMAPSFMNINTTVPIQKITSGFGDFDSKPFRWDDDSSPEREPSPPMPTIPPPPPPVVDDEPTWPEDVQDFLSENILEDIEDTQPYAIALFDYFTDHEEDLCFSANSKIYLIRRVNEEWLSGRLKNGVEGLFPSNYVEIKVPLPNDVATKPILGEAIALYDFEPVQTGDLQFSTGDSIRVMQKLNEEWYFGECKGVKGQFPANYVQMS
ncbi:PREDICTED: SH3 domain-containing protein 19 isoform X1 [Papilio xuthus]|uniref:SH3 domain-containing protein 19 isoform X1 n=2 Tax=Papilio xuthus TaxID=66420 RepID=A0AAJ6Z6N2_PAPXU|nr:PREDICTED: SH3 domain-containing protein 19 isoform X1 [Papilio xuthus]